MKLLSYTVKGVPSYGIHTGTAIIDIGSRPDRPGDTLKEALGDPQALTRLADLPAQLQPSEVVPLPPIWNADRIICAGLNYKEHIKELGAPTPEIPVLFVRFADSLVADQQPLVRPTASVEFDFEGELAVVIGKPGRHIPVEQAGEHIAGYSCFNDGTLRDFQRRGFQFLPGKSFWRSGSFGPFIVTPDEAGDIGSATLVTTVNGLERQRSSIDDLLFGVPELISFISMIMPLRTGDVIATGTPGGVAAALEGTPWLVPGDVVEVSIDGLGVLRNVVIDEADLPIGSDLSAPLLESAT